MVPRAVLVSCELRAALIRSGQAGAPQRGQGDGRKVLRTGGFDDEGIYTKVLKWNLLEFTRIYFFGGDYTRGTWISRMTQKEGAANNHHIWYLQT